MNIEVDSRLTTNPAWTKVATQANAILQELPGPATVEASAAWKPVANEPDRVILELYFPDPPITLSRSISLSEVQSESKLERQLSKFYNDFSTEISRRLGARVRERLALMDKD